MALPVIVLTEPSVPVDTNVVATTADPALGTDVAAVDRADDADAEAEDEADALSLTEDWLDALDAEDADVTSVLEVAEVALVTSVLVSG